MLFLDVLFDSPWEDQLPSDGKLLFIGRCQDASFVKASTYVVYSIDDDGAFVVKEQSQNVAGERNVRLVFPGPQTIVMTALGGEVYNKRWPTFVMNGFTFTYSVVGEYMDFNHYKTQRGYAKRLVTSKAEGGYAIKGNYVDENESRGFWLGSIAPFTESGHAAATIAKSQGTERYQCHTKVYVNNAFLIFGNPPFKNRWRKIAHTYKDNISLRITTGAEDRTHAI